MDLTPEDDVDSGYEASMEAGNENASPTSGASSFNPHLSVIQSHISNLHFSSKSQHQVGTELPPYKGTFHRSISSAAPIKVRESVKRVRSPRKTSSTSSSSSTTTASDHAVAHVIQPVFQAGMTAREVAERAQDATLIRSGSQKTPAQLLRKRKRTIVSKDGLSLQSAPSCFDCQLKKIRCSHVSAEPRPKPAPSTHQALQDAMGFIVPRTHAPNKTDKNRTSAFQGAQNAANQERETTTQRTRQHGKPSKWQERRLRENSKIAGVQKSKETDSKSAGAPTGIVKKKGRPVGWRKGMGLTYAEVKRLSMEEREGLLKQSGFKH